MDQKAQWYNLFIISLNSFHGKKSRDGFSPYEVKFAASPEHLSLPTVMKNEAFLSRESEIHQTRNFSK